MSKENLERFMTQAADSEELQARIGEEIDAETLIALGAEHGCEFSADDLTAGAELSDEELDGVAGGSAFVKLGDRRSPHGWIIFSDGSGDVRGPALVPPPLPECGGAE
jgi:predicted ribosomally synthesized peptide with nif11-like leader